MVIEHSGAPTLAKRLLLLAYPDASPAELRRLNYKERRMALFLAFKAVELSAAVSADNQSMNGSGSDSITDSERSFVFNLRRLTAGEDRPLLRSIISFL
jgi:hypothetical protein